MKEKIQKLIDLGVSATTIAEGIGCGKSTISNWLAGRRNMSAENEKRFEAWLEEFKSQITAV